MLSQAFYLKTALFFFFTLLYSVLFNNVYGQTLDYYKGMHYGAHQPWNFYSQTHITRIGDTLIYERKVHPAEPPFDNQPIMEVNFVKMIVKDQDNVTVFLDTLNYNWKGGPKYTKKKVNDSLSMFYHDPKKINFDAKYGKTYKLAPNALTFTSVPAIALYLINSNIDIGFEKHVYIAENDALRPFAIRVLDMINIRKNPSIWVYDISINSLDKNSLYSGKIYLTVHTKRIVKIEYVANDFKHKSVLNEYLLGPEPNTD
ncbi:MAG: hypothetical protein ISP68_04800 [Flavobacteriaceae bacterium]|nr:hypothetical protein [Flavobacteriaceae bacterium]